MWYRYDQTKSVTPHLMTTEALTYSHLDKMIRIMLALVQPSSCKFFMPSPTLLRVNKLESSEIYI